ncbi:MAG: sulfatase-like hydrolase/transferase [Candidatus Wallbacteria bacterium]|nr:sulfatase-like hydrolase/transferase [Candidatus Wallbacteria bacterium]
MMRSRASRIVRSRSSGGVSLAAAVFLAVAVCAPVAGWAAPARRPNVVLFFIDTLRAKQVHCLGYPRRTTDSLDAEAARGVLFERAIAPSGWSLPSYSSIFTSIPAPAHAAQEKSHVLDPALTTLAEIFSANGYRTGGFVAGGHLSAVFGLAKGFQVYRDRPHFGSFFHTVPEAAEWLAQKDERPFFVFLQGYDAHAPYPAPLGFGDLYDPGYPGIVHTLSLMRDANQACLEGSVFHVPPGLQPEPDPFPPMPRWGPLSGLAAWLEQWRKPQPPARAPSGDVPFTPADAAHVVAHYDGAVTYADGWLGVFLETLERMGHRQDTLLVVAGDHGEEMGERGVFGHRRTLPDTQIHVPVVLSGPGVARGRRVPDVVELTDLAPTLVDLCGIPPNQAHQGRSLRPYLDPAKDPGQDLERVAFSARGIVLSARTRRWHLLIEGETRQLFDLESDPNELHDACGREPATAERLAGKLHDWDERYHAEARSGIPALTEEEKSLFRRHGYW